ncbi:2-hydroxyacid dehydrogenase [Ureibacillus manganicus]|uniref:Glyoxylate reductase n=1 Tax=Ureibacillus manganicus DSM 26584 TaxID=1384049 RepID=A0A0A3HVV2_9BACL|nr:D-glycerate dehydrogenase [Ureibacillus manganicus]KGR76736.1 glyoxylate reductase [Ureibacillus manganicus DSM 26584]
MKPKVLITRRIPEPIIDKIREVADVFIWEKEDIPIPRDLLETKIVEVEGLFCLLTESIDAQLLEKAKNLKVISNMAVGYNNIDIETATKKGILVTNTPDVLTETTADLTFALLMATARRLVEASDFLRAGQWQTWSPNLLTGQDIFGATIGIIGMGRIGEAVARRTKGFNMKLLYNNRNRKLEVEQELGATYVPFEELLRESDFILVMTPYTTETKNLITAEHFKLMKKNAILINTARGGIVNESDLYEALVKGEIWAAGLDVFEQEPISTDHPLLTLPNVVTLPHIGSASIATRMKMADLAADNLVQAIRGEMPLNLVNKQ